MDNIVHKLVLRCLSITIAAQVDSNAVCYFSGAQPFLVCGI